MMWERDKPEACWYCGKRHGGRTLVVQGHEITECPAMVGREGTVLGLDVRAVAAARPEAR
jgi:hypothetical protein